MTFDAVIELLVLAPFLILSARRSAICPPPVEQSVEPQAELESGSQADSKLPAESISEKGLVMESEKPVWQMFRK